MSREGLAALGLREEELKCGSCQSQLFLVLQMDSPWSGEEAFFDRILYVFGCNSRICTETQGEKAWKAFVLQTPSRDAASAAAVSSSNKAPTASLWDTVMLGAASPAPASDAAAGIQSLSLADASFYSKTYPVGFPPLRLHICEEMIYEQKKKNRAAVEDDLAPQAIPAGLTATEEEQWAAEAYESTQSLGMDKTFMAFQKRVSSYPRQCARFSPAGAPLPFRQERLPSAGSCPACGQQRVFELQLMPAVLSLLPCGDEQHLKHLPAQLRGQHPLFGDSMEWGTLLVYTCGTCTRATAGTQLIRAFTHTQIEAE